MARTTAPDTRARRAAAWQWRLEWVAVRSSEWNLLLDAAAAGGRRVEAKQAIRSVLELLPQ